MANVILYNQLGYRPLVWRTIGCYLLARWIEENGYTCQVIEFTHLFDPQELYEYTKMFVDDDTILIGASSNMWSTYRSELMMNVHARSVPDNIYNALKEIKKEFPKIKTAVGGHRGYHDMQGMEVFDFKCVIDWGEDWLLNLLDELSNKKIGTRLKRNKFDFNHHRFIFKDHDCLLPNETVPLEWGRGCIFKCPFCKYPNLGKKAGTNEKDGSLMVDVLTEMYERYGTTSYYFLDETFNADNERLETLHKVSQRLPFKLEFISYNRPDLLDKHPHTIDLLQESGLRATLLGMETFHPEASKLVLKPWSGRRGKDFLLELREKWQKVHIDCSLIGGLPGVSREHHFETGEWFSKSEIGFFTWKPLVMIKGSESYQSTWEDNAKNLKIEWPDDSEPFFWKWGEYTYLEAFQLTCELNREFKVHERPFGFSLGAYTTAGLKIEQIVNHKIKDIIALTGDLYDLEQKLFEEYKLLLKSKA